MPTLIIEYKTGEVKRHSGFISANSHLIRIDLGGGATKFLPITAVTSVIQIDGDGKSITSHEKKIKEMVREMLTGKPELKLKTGDKMVFDIPENMECEPSIDNKQTFPSVANASN